MALYYPNLVHLLKARAAGLCFSRTLTVSRLNLCLSPVQARQVASKLAGTPAAGGREYLQRHRFGEYADEFLKLALGVSTLDSLDFSDYEGATILHDLNLPAPESLANRFDAIIDAGTLEHLFNVPVALTNLARMLRVGGSMFLFPPANNACGHGFYQFSPDFFFRVFTEENGFALEALYLYEGTAVDQHGLGASRKVYRVIDPKVSGWHGPLRLPRGPVCLLVQARKIRECENLFSPAPVQTVYSQTWQEAAQGDSAKEKSPALRLAKQIWRGFPTALRLPITRLRESWEGCLWNRRAYVPVDFSTIT